MTISTGTIIDERVTLLELIGSGGMGAVYLGNQCGMERFVAVKLLDEKCTPDSDQYKRFAREAQLTSKLRHRNIVTIYGYGIWQEQPYMLLEYFPGVNLQSMLDDNQSLELDQALTIALHIANGLQCAHDNGIVHRDIKPSNILIADTGEARIIDFGLAKQVQMGNSQALTEIGQTVGSVLYMSPEQCLGKDIGPTSDIYSFGVLLYHMLHGAPPFEGTQSIQVMQQHVYSEPPHLVAPDDDIVLKRVDELVSTCLNKHPGDRFPNGSALATELSEIRKLLEKSFEHQRISIRKSLAAESSGQQKSVEAGSHRDADRTGQGLKRNRSPKGKPVDRIGTVLIVAAVLVCVSALVAGNAMLKNQRAQQNLTGKEKIEKLQSTLNSVRRQNLTDKEKSAQLFLLQSQIATLLKQEAQSVNSSDTTAQHEAATAAMQAYLQLFDIDRKNVLLADTLQKGLLIPGLNKAEKQLLTAKLAHAFYEQAMDHILNRDLDGGLRYYDKFMACQPHDDYTQDFWLQRNLIQGCEQSLRYAEALRISNDEVEGLKTHPQPKPHQAETLARNAEIRCALHEPSAITAVHESEKLIEALKKDMEDSETIARTETTLGGAYLNIGDFAGCIRCSNEALDDFKRAKTEGLAYYSPALENRIHALIHTGHYMEAKADAFAVAAAHFNAKEVDWTLDFLTGVANDFGSVKDFRDALDIAEYAEKRISDYPDQNALKYHHAISLLLITGANNGLGHFDASRRALERADMVAGNEPSVTLAQVKTSITELALNDCNWQRARDNAICALACWQKNYKSAGAPESEAYTYSLAAQAEQHLGNWKQAEQNYMQAITIMKSCKKDGAVLENYERQLSDLQRRAPKDSGVTTMKQP